MFNKLFIKPTLLQGAILGGGIVGIPIVFYLIVEEASPPLGGLMALLLVAGYATFTIVGHPRLWGRS